ncbi:MAG: response regulator [Rhizobiales bacterium]|nr:response regulator [Hyphomicrobiales bacterium]
MYNSQQPDGFVVLVVEDEYFIADEIEQALRAEGVEVLGPVAYVSEALSQIEAHRVDAVILDINLRGELAFAVADELAARSIPFVFATGYDPQVTPERHRAVPRWEKPYDIGSLIAYISELRSASRS